MNKTALASVLALLIIFPSTVVADGPLDCPGVPNPTIEQAQQELYQHGELVWLADKAGADPIAFAEGKIRYDYCYLQQNNLTTQCEVITSQWPRDVGYVALFGISIPVVTPTATPQPTPRPTPRPTTIPSGVASGAAGIPDEPLY